MGALLPKGSGACLWLHQDTQSFRNLQDRPRVPQGLPCPVEFVAKVTMLILQVVWISSQCHSRGRAVMCWRSVFQVKWSRGHKAYGLMDCNGSGKGVAQ